MDWSILGDVAKTVIGAGIGTAAVQALVPICRDYRQRKKQAGYLAMRVAIVLETYARDCTQFLETNDNAEHPPDEQYPYWEVILPDLGAFPEDPDAWRALDPALASRCLNFPNRIKGSQGFIRNQIDFAMDDLKSTLDEQASKRGWEAWELAGELRREYGFKAVETDWDYADVLRRTMERVRKARENEEKNSDI